MMQILEHTPVDYEILQPHPDTTRATIHKALLIAGILACGIVSGGAIYCLVQAWKALAG